MEIRKIVEEDHEAFRALRLEALQDSPTAFGSDYEREAALSREKFNRGLKPGDEFREAFVLGASTRDGRLVGMAGFHVFNRPKTRHKAWIWGMYVAPDQRGKGIGTSLLRGIFGEAARVTGLEQVHLTVVATNSGARELYEKIGFVEYGCEPDSLRVDGVDYDEIYMVLKLADRS